MISQRDENRYFIRDLKTGKDRERMPNISPIRPFPLTEYNLTTEIEFSDDMRYFAYQDREEARLIVWDAETGSDVCEVPVEPQHLTAYAFLADNKTLVTVVDPDPKNVRGYHSYDYAPNADPLPMPPIEGETHAVIEFWDLDDLIWDKHQVNIFPKRTRVCYLEEEIALRGLVASPDGKLLYARTSENVREKGSILNIGIGYIFVLDPNDKIELPAELEVSKQFVR